MLPLDGPAREGWQAVRTERVLMLSPLIEPRTSWWKSYRSARVLTVLAVLAMGAVVSLMPLHGQVPKSTVGDVESAWINMPWNWHQDAHQDTEHEQHGAHQSSIELPPDLHNGVYIENMNVDVSSQNGVTANIHAGVDFANDMSDTLHDNNDAVSEDGDVKRLNGAYDNNAEAGRGDVTRANGAAVGNALSARGAASRRGGAAALDAALARKLCCGPGAGGEAEGDGDSRELRESCRALRGAPRPAGARGGGSGHLLGWLSEMTRAAGGRRRDGLRGLLRLLLPARGNLTRADRERKYRRLLSWLYGMRTAQKEERRESIAEVLSFLYGPRNLTNGSYASVDEEGNRLYFDFFQKMLAKEVEGLLVQRKMVDDIVDHLSDPSFAKSLNINLQRLQQNESQGETADVAAEVGEIIGSLERAHSLNRGPLVIHNVNIKVRHQNGLQANLGAGVRFRNNMSGSLQYNNDAVSKRGDVSRINGAYDNNARSANGSVLRANGAFDRNARSGSGPAELRAAPR